MTARIGMGLDCDLVQLADGVRNDMMNEFPVEKDDCCVPRHTRLCVHATDWPHFRANHMNQLFN